MRRKLTRQINRELDIRVEVTRPMSVVGVNGFASVSLLSRLIQRRCHTQGHDYAPLVLRPFASNSDSLCSEDAPHSTLYEFKLVVDGSS
jgi:hypothetical protein